MSAFHKSERFLLPGEELASPNFAFVLLEDLGVAEAPVQAQRDAVREWLYDNDPSPTLVESLRRSDLLPGEPAAALTAAPVVASPVKRHHSLPRSSAKRRARRRRVRRRRLIRRHLLPLMIIWVAPLVATATALLAVGELDDAGPPVVGGVAVFVTLVVGARYLRLMLLARAEEHLEDDYPDAPVEAEAAARAWDNRDTDPN